MSSTSQEQSSIRALFTTDQGINYWSDYTFSIHYRTHRQSVWEVKYGLVFIRAYVTLANGEGHLNGWKRANDGVQAAYQLYLARLVTEP